MNEHEFHQMFASIKSGCCFKRQYKLTVIFISTMNNYCDFAMA